MCILSANQWAGTLSRASGRLWHESFERWNHLPKITQLDTESLNPGPFAFPDKGEPTSSACSAAGHLEQPLSHLSPHKSPQPWSSPERISNIQFLGSCMSHESVTAIWPQGVLREPGAVPCSFSRAAKGNPSVTGDENWTDGDHTASPADFDLISLRNLEQTLL